MPGMVKLQFFVQAVMAGYLVILYTYTSRLDMKQVIPHHIRIGTVFRFVYDGV